MIWRVRDRVRVTQVSRVVQEGVMGDSGLRHKCPGWPERLTGPPGSMFGQLIDAFFRTFFHLIYN